VKYRGLNGTGRCAPVSITVASLGIQFPRRTAEGEFQFDVVTAFAGTATVIEVSSDLIRWFPVSTNVPATSLFTFTGASPSSSSNVFYRVHVQP